MKYQRLQLILPVFFILVLLFHHPFRALQRPVDDLVHRVFHKSQLSHPIKIVYFDDQAIAQLQGFPIARNIYSYLIHVLNQLKTAVIGLDIFFPATSSRLDENDRLLIEMNRQFDNIINSYYFKRSAGDSIPASLPVQPIAVQSANLVPATAIRCHLPFAELLGANPRAGFSNINLDKKGILRSCPLVIKINDQTYPSFALRIALAYLEQIHPAANPVSQLPLLQSTLKERYEIHFTTMPDQLVLIPAIELLQAFQTKNNSESRTIDLDQFENSIVLISVLSENFGSYKPVPVSAAYPIAGIHAQVIENILCNDFLHDCPFWVELAILLLLLLLFLILEKIRHNFRIIIAIVTGIVYLPVYVVLFHAGTVLPLTTVEFFIAMAIVLIFVTRLRQQGKILDIVIDQRMKTEQELNEKITRLTDLEQQIQRLRGVAVKNLQQKIADYRTEIKSLQARLNDLLIATPVQSEPGDLQSVFPELIFAATSPMVPILQTVCKVAGANSTVYLSGESGTGKELIARAIHRLSLHKDAPFIAVNCAALPENLIESELFGYQRGAFTGATADRKGKFEAADGGTLFLDEISATSLNFQAKLLRVVQHKEFFRLGDVMPIRIDVRIIVASNRDLRELVASHQFREDLYYRLSVIQLSIPPLRDRKDDIPLLIQHFVDKQQKQFSRAAMELLINYHFPGNVRELQNLVQRCMIVNESPIISAEWLKTQLTEIRPDDDKPDNLAGQILELLRHKGFKFNAISEIAAELGNVHRSTVTEHLKGLLFQSFYENKFSLDRTVRSLNPDQNLENDKRLKNRLVYYLRNLQQAISYELSYEENLVRMSSRFKNLPKQYHFFMKEIIRKLLNNDLPAY